MLIELVVVSLAFAVAHSEKLGHSFGGFGRGKERFPCYRFRITENTKHCSTADGRNPEHGFRLRYLELVLYHKHTRLIFARQRWRLDVDLTHNVYAPFVYNETWTDVGLGAYFLFLRYGEMRKNESPFSNVYVRDTTKLADGKVIKELPGKGSDVSQMYHGTPLMFSFSLSHVQAEGSEKILWKYEPTNCARTATWIANEGVYKLDPETGELTPIYYDPRETDIFY